MCLMSPVGSSALNSAPFSCSCRITVAAFTCSRGIAVKGTLQRDLCQILNYKNSSSSPLRNVYEFLEFFKTSKIKHTSYFFWRTLWRSLAFVVTSSFISYDITMSHLDWLTFLACRLPTRWCSRTAREGKERWHTWKHGLVKTQNPIQGLFEGNVSW